MTGKSSVPVSMRERSFLQNGNAVSCREVKGHVGLRVCLHEKAGGRHFLAAERVPEAKLCAQQKIKAVDFGKGKRLVLRQRMRRRDADKKPLVHPFLRAVKGKRQNGNVARAALPVREDLVILADGRGHELFALRFLMQSGVVVIPKSTHKERMQENFDLFDFMLRAEDMAAIKALDSGEILFFSHYDPKTVEWFMSIL